jgi:Zn-dependent peptidase ImmA (M78 family)/DNA-binding Xre family transcriptional regulator
VIKLTQYLAQRRISLEEAAQKSGISLERLERVDAGEELSLGELRKLSSALKISIGDLKSKRRKFPDLEVMFRRGAGKLDPRKAGVIDLLSSEIAAVFDIASGLPPNTAWISAFPQVEQTKEDAELIAELFRQHFLRNDQQSPFLSLPKVVSEQLGIFLIVVPNLPIEGASVRLNDYAFILLAPRSFRPRMLFSLAHEIGHFVAQHHSGIREFANLDFEGELGAWRAPQEPLEVFADRFASALLLPAQGVAVALKTFRELHKISGPLGDIEIAFLSRFFGVSFEVAGRRCEDLDLLQRGAARALYEEVTEKHKSPEKRADEVGLPPRADILEFATSSRLLHAAAGKINSGEISIGRAAEALHVAIADLFAANIGTK